jgi:hypothetical protein
MRLVDVSTRCTTPESRNEVQTAESLASIERPSWTPDFFVASRSAKGCAFAERTESRQSTEVALLRVFGSPTRCGCRRRTSPERRCQL